MCWESHVWHRSQRWNSGHPSKTSRMMGKWLLRPDRGRPTKWLLERQHKRFSGMSSLMCVWVLPGNVVTQDPSVRIPSDRVYTSHGWQAAPTAMPKCVWSGPGDCTFTVASVASWLPPEARGKTLNRLCVKNLSIRMEGSLEDFKKKDKHCSSNEIIFLEEKITIVITYSLIWCK